jgi:phosphoglycolate phosphatase-like HAD superfamily hydrolase
VSLPEAVLFDMDGTLVDVAGIRPLLGGPGRFDAFHRASIDCPPNQWVVDAAKAERAAGRAVLIVTARQAAYRNITAWWLALHDVPSDAMYMRATNDNRPDHIVKAEILAKIRQRYDVVAAWDDRPEVIALWESEGIPVTPVPGWGGHKTDATTQ